MPKEVIYSLTLDVKNPDIPFAIQKSISSESGDLVRVFAEFNLLLIQLLKELHREEMLEIMHDRCDDDIPF